jgi:polyether ionophore transport system permease protein
MGADTEADAGILTVRTIRPSARSRLFGLGSVYGKTLRDSRRAVLLVGLAAGAFMLATATPYGTEFTTAASRAQLVAQMSSLPAVFRGLLGEPINIETLGGFLAWRVGNILPVLLGLWPVLALSGTLAGEAEKGSLDLVVSTPQARRSIAVQKVAAHVTGLTVAMLITAVLIVIAGQIFAVLPEDEIPLSAALGQVVLYGLYMLAAGAMTFAASFVLGRTRAVALGIVALFGMYLIASYATLSPTIEALSPFSWYAWTAGHRPMAGVTDWASVGFLGAVTVGLLVVGILAFERRDLVASNALSWLRLPSLPAGIRGPFTRQLADRTAVALAWGAGVGLYAALIASSAQAFTDSLNQIPGIIDYINRLYPTLDFTQPSAILQLAFFGFGSLMIGLAGAGFVAGWAGDEGGRRLDSVLSTPVSRTGWFIRSGLGVYAAIAVSVTLLGVFVAVAVASQGGDVVEPVVGAAIVGVASAGFAGIGLAAGGLFRASLAAPVAALGVIASFLLDTLGEALDLPDEILDLSVYQHLGQPMAGTYDLVGIAVALVLAIGGLMLGAWGLHRRDLAG